MTKIANLVFAHFYSHDDVDDSKLVTNLKMIRVAAIRNNHLSIRCWCGHAGLIPVKAFIEKFGPDITADQAVTRTRCTKCGASVRAGSQIVYVGNSEFAMSGSRTAQDSE